MVIKHIKMTLERRNVSYTTEDDSFCFKHPECPKAVDCLITWDETRKQVQFVADYEVKLPPTLDNDSFAALLNDLNYDSSWGNLETDGHGLLVYRLATFLPDGRDAAVAICTKALDFFLKASILRLHAVEARLKKLREESAHMDERHFEEESLKSRIFELECLHHRVMQLAEVADILFEEYQLVCSDAMTQARLGDAGKKRVVRDVRVLRQNEEQLHSDIRAFAQRCGLPLKMKDLRSGWSLHEFKQDFALTGFLNTAVTDLFLALCKGGNHAA